MAVYVADSAKITIRDMTDPDGIPYLHARYFAGDNDPWASCVSFDAGRGAKAHFHLGSQFQLLVNGTLDMPPHHLKAPAVHYTDHCTPYGPFQGSPGYWMMILGPRGRARRTMVFSHSAKDNPKVRQLVNRGGRSFACSAEEVEWQAAAEGLRTKTLFSVPQGPAAEIAECRPSAAYVDSRMPRHGQWRVVLAGSVLHDGAELGPRSVQYVEGDQAPAPLQAGPKGATLAVLTFDEDAHWMTDPRPTGSVSGADSPTPFTLRLSKGKGRSKRDG